MGSTHYNLKSRVKKHYKEVWKIVQNKCGEKELGKDVSENIGRSSMAHFAKHCRNFSTSDEVTTWCEDNMKVEKWTMVCRKCLGTSIDTPNEQNCSVMSFKVESKFETSDQGFAPDLAPIPEKIARRYGYLPIANNPLTDVGAI